MHWLGVGDCKASESTENWGYTRLFAEKIKKNTFLVEILPQFTRSNAIFSETDYGTLLFSVVYEGTFTTKHDDAQHTHREGALGMLFFNTKFPEQQADHCDDINKRHYKLSNGNVLKGCQDVARQPKCSRSRTVSVIVVRPTKLEEYDLVKVRWGTFMCARCLTHCTASIHALSHSTRCLTPHAASVCAWPLSACCLTLCASYVTQHAVSFDALFHSTNVSHSTRCLALHVLSTNSIIAVDKYWNTENNFIRQGLLCEHCSQVLVCCVSTLVECWSVSKHSN